MLIQLIPSLQRAPSCALKSPSNLRKVISSLLTCQGLSSTAVALSSQCERYTPLPVTSVTHSHIQRSFSALSAKDSPSNSSQSKPKLLQRLVGTAPPSVQPYLKLARVDSPAGCWLLFIPSAWAIALATPIGELPSVTTLALFGLGAVLMRGAGCVINDFWDKDIDKAVARTRTRPLASGQISPKQALVFLTGLLSASLVVLLQFNWYSVILGLSSMGLVISYPSCKRWTHWPQLWLGFTFNWGALLGYAAVHHVCDWSVCLPLYIAAIHWTLLYDTIYAHQDKSDDAVIGVKSTALLFGSGTKKWLSLFAGGNLVWLTLCGMCAGAGLPFYLGATLFNAHLWHQIYRVDLDSPNSCFHAFKSNRNAGLLLFSGIVLDRLLTFPGL